MSVKNKKRKSVSEDLRQQRLLRDARSLISAALGEMHRRNSQTAVAGDATSTFESSLQDAVFEIDSQPDIVDPFLDSAIGYELALSETSKSFEVGSLQVPRKIGRLQRLRNLKVALFGGRVTTVGEDGLTSSKSIEGILESLKYVTTTDEVDR